MTDDEFLKLCRAASKTQQMKVLLMTTTLVEYKRRRKKAAKQRKRIEKYHRDFIATINKIMGGDA